jgi:periplasmic iron binding protein
MRINRIYREGMCFLRALPAACLAVFFMVVPTQAVVLGGPLLRDGLEIVPGMASEIELDRTVAHGPNAIFLVADIHAAKGEAHGFPEHAFIPYLSVSYALTKDDMPTFKRAGLLYPVAAKGGPHYAAVTELSGPGAYHLTYIISPPSAHGMWRRTDKTEGVPDWWKPITASWTFTYTQNTK